jgi:hypothetical protein
LRRVRPDNSDGPHSRRRLDVAAVIARHASGEVG